MDLLVSQYIFCRRSNENMVVVDTKQQYGVREIDGNLNNKKVI